MVVKIRFGLGPVVTRRKGKNGRMASLGASLLTLGSICLGSLGVWRLGQDLDLAGDFVFPSGFLSHWQVWIGSAIVFQYGAWHLTRYARLEKADVPGEPISAPEPATPRILTNV